MKAFSFFRFIAKTLVPLFFSSLVFSDCIDPQLMIPKGPYSSKKCDENICYQAHFSYSPETDLLSAVFLEKTVTNKNGSIDKTMWHPIRNDSIKNDTSEQAIQTQELETELIELGTNNSDEAEVIDLSQIITNHNLSLNNACDYIDKGFTIDLKVFDVEHAGFMLLPPAEKLSTLQVSPVNDASLFTFYINSIAGASYPGRFMRSCSHQAYFKTSDILTAQCGSVKTIFPYFRYLLVDNLNAMNNNYDLKSVGGVLKVVKQDGLSVTAINTRSSIISLCESEDMDKINTNFGLFCDASSKYSTFLESLKKNNNYKVIIDDSTRDFAVIIKTHEIHSPAIMTGVSQCFKNHLNLDYYQHSNQLYCTPLATPASAANRAPEAGDESSITPTTDDSIPYTIIKKLVYAFIDLAMFFTSNHKSSTSQ